MIQAEQLPLWVGIPVIAFLLLGSLLTLVGALGLYRLPDFYQRIHGPAVVVTLGLGCVLIASMGLFSYWQSRPVVHELLITLFVFMSAPVSAMLMMRAAMYRRKK
ncbi:MAG: monovalent cation/H(+) antiporter subunit G [Venatoribacter sp.]